MKRGLVLGKFAPLHKGHQFLIETALGKVDELVVLVYEARTVTDVPLSVRAAWVRRLYPQTQVLEGVNAPEQAGDTPEIMGLQEDYIRSVVPLPITHFFSSEWYGEHVSRALHAEDCRVDTARLRYSISGTRIRKDPWLHRAFLDPLVYLDLVRKVVFLGAESTGKTTIAQALAERLGTRWMPEYGREYWELCKDADGKLSEAQMVELAVEHMNREDHLASTCRNILFVDTNALTTRLFCRFYHATSPAELDRLAEHAESRYSHTFVCGTDIPYEDDGTRNGREHRERFQQWIINDLDQRGVKWKLLEGPLERRIGQVETVLAAMPHRPEAIAIEN